MSNETVNPETGEITAKISAADVAEESVGARCEMWSAFIKAQAVIEQPKRTKPVTVRTKDGQYKFDYAPIEEVMAVAKKPLADNGLAIRQMIIEKNTRSYIRTHIVHVSGEYMENDYPIIVGGPSAQSYAGGVTYARRYGILLALGIASEDDDGNAADGNTIISGGPGGASGGPPNAPTNRRPATTPVQQPDPNRTAATEARNRLRDGIDNAKALNQLPALTKEDETLIRSVVSGNDRIGDRIWQSLIDLDAEKRLALAQAEADQIDEDPFDSFMRPEDTGNALGR